MSSKAKLQSLLTKIANWDEFYYRLDEPGLGTPGENGPALTLFRFSLSVLYTKYWLKPLQIYSAGINGSGGAGFVWSGEGVAAPGPRRPSGRSHLRLVGAALDSGRKGV